MCPKIKKRKIKKIEESYSINKLVLYNTGHRKSVYLEIILNKLQKSSSALILILIFTYSLAEK